ncbi:MAG: chorismate synthase [Candidatus Omnitrophota bacterium]|nr:MAG: chorismate synthase [Candidatus Omnitrophota bacterium]
MRFLTGGESHSKAIVAILEGFPKGVRIDERVINRELERRQQGFGRGKRMQIEKDRVEIISGLRNKVTLGSPICMVVENRDQKIYPQKKDELLPIRVPRPGHGDLAGSLKYGEKDITNILERASARTTVAWVCIGSICKQLLSQFNIKIASFVVSVGKIFSSKRPKSVEEIIKKTKISLLNCIDRGAEKAMVKEIRKAERAGDTLGGVVEIWAQGVPPGLGSFMHLDRRLDAKIAFYLMGLPGVKGIEIGLGFEYARKRGSSSHDVISYSSLKGFYRKTNNCGGIEAGISNGQPIVVRVAMKPISTLRKPLDSVNLLTKKREKAPVIRSDICAIVPLGVIGENMLAIALGELFLEKFGNDSLREIKKNYRNYLKTL